MNVRKDGPPVTHPSLALAALILAMSVTLPHPVQAGSPNFLWKPVSESDGNLAVLFPSNYRKEDLRSIAIVTADGRSSQASRISQTGVNGDRIHARFSRPGSSFGTSPRVVMTFKDGTTRSWNVPGGAKRYDRADAGQSGGRASGGSSLDDVLAEGDGPSPAGTQGRGGEGKGSYVVEADAELEASAYLHTWGPARLQVLIRSADGSERSWLAWQRDGDTDSSPLSVDGEDRPESIFEQAPGDFSPKAMTLRTRVRKGDRIATLLSGDFGPAEPHLRLRCTPEDALRRD